MSMVTYLLHDHGDFVMAIVTNLYHKQNHEFETLLNQVRPAKSVINNYNGKMIGFSDF